MTETWWVDSDQLDEAQKSVIDLPLGRHHLVLGPPGSGKTNLLLLRANYLIMAGEPNVLLLVLTKSLREFLVAGARRYMVPEDRILTSMRWRIELLQQYGEKVGPPRGAYPEQREALHGAVTNLVKRQNLSKIYDAILLDEAQDCLPEEIELLTRLARNVFAVADSRQKIYDGPDPIDALKKLVTKPMLLRYHYRNGPEICKLADAIAKDSDGYEPMLTSSNYDEKKNGTSTVESFCCEKFEAEVDLALDRLSAQLKAYPNQLIGMLCPRRSQVEILSDKLQGSEFAARFVVHRGGEHGMFEADKDIYIGTFHSGKGLEFRALHLVGCDKLRGMSFARNLAFMAVTRAKTSLSVYHSAPLHGFFEGALMKLKPVPKVPTHKDVFKGRR
jgi:superfamily I DNA/RNA helicase